MTIDDDHIVLAGEWVLGTLDGEEYRNAEALIASEPEFAALVAEWERRLGELNVLVAPLEPPAELFARIIARLPGVAHADQIPVLETNPERQVIENLAATLGVGMHELPGEGAAPAPSDGVPVPMPPPPLDGDVRFIRLRQRVRRWQTAGAVFGTLAAAMAAVLVTSLVRPELLPVQLQPKPRVVEVVKTVEVPAKPVEPARFTAVLQRDAASPAFILTVDLADRTMTVRRVAADDQAGRSYELWLVSNRYPGPRSLGVMAPGEFTRPTQLNSFDQDTIRDAVFAISLEPEGGSPTAAPTGPVLFTGKLVETLPPGSTP